MRVRSFHCNEKGDYKLCFSFKLRFLYLCVCIRSVSVRIHGLSSCQWQGWSVVKMSRPGTRSKNKRNKQGDNVDTTAEILRYEHFLLMLKVLHLLLFVHLLIILDSHCGFDVGKFMQQVK